jgi:5'-3' exonuclease
MKIALIDGNALCHVVKHATKNLSFNGSSTGVLFGLVRKLFNIQEKLFANKYVFCWDSKGVLERKKVYPGYKDNRKEQKAEEAKLNEIAIPQFNLARVFMLPTIGFNGHYLQDGLEADDVIAQLCLRYKDEHEMIIVSRDNDFFQLLDEGKVSMFDPVKFGYTTKRTFKAKWGVEPENWDFVKAIAGCSGDGVIGVKGVAEATAIKFLKGELKTTTKKHKDIIANEDMIIDNLRLVKLPWDPTPEFELVDDNLSKEGFIKICMEYGFRSYLTEGLPETFEKLFMEAQ